MNKDEYAQTGGAVYPREPVELAEPHTTIGTSTIKKCSPRHYMLGNQFKRRWAADAEGEKIKWTRRTSVSVGRSRVRKITNYWDVEPRYAPSHEEAGRT